MLAGLFNVTCDELLGVEKETPKVVPEELVDTGKMLLKLKVISSDGDIVKMNLPLAMAEPFLKSSNINVGNDALKNIDFSQIIAMAKAGTVGKLLEVNSADGDIVEIWVE